MFILIIVMWLCKMLTLGKVGLDVYGYSLLYNFSGNKKLIQN